VGFYNTIKHYRFAATIFLTTLGYLLGQIFANLRVQHLTWWHNVILVVIVYSVITWFVNITADAAEGILTSFLQENANSKGNIEEMQNVRSVRDDLFRITGTISLIVKGDKPIKMDVAESDLH
jgi:hypothetical protein